MDKLKLGIIFGGRSEEHEVSVKSAVACAKDIDTDKYEPVWLGITSAGAWKLVDTPTTDWESGQTRQVVLSPDPTVHGLIVLDGDGYQTIRLDVVLPLMHGKFGEDGKVQGLLDYSGIPYVGCDLQASVLCMDKSLAYLTLNNAGITTPGFWISTPESPVDPASLPYPVVVKPARSGSSFGVTKIESSDELAAAIDEAAQYDTKVLIEETVVGSEIGCAVLGEGDDLITGECDQISLTGGVFRVHQEAKPGENQENSSVKVPADIPEADRARLKEAAKAIYRALGCKGLARVDMFFKDNGDIVLNEVNTLPGMTEYSRYSRMMTGAGISRAEVMERLISLALTGKPQ